MPPKKSLHQASNNDGSGNEGPVVSVGFPSPFVQKRLEIDQTTIREFRKEIGMVKANNTEDPKGVVCNYVDAEYEEVEEYPEQESQKLRVLGENISISDSTAEILRGAILGREVPEIIVKVRGILPTVRFNFPDHEEEE